MHLLLTKRNYQQFRKRSRLSRMLLNKRVKWNNLKENLSLLRKTSKMPRIPKKIKKRKRKLNRHLM